MTKRHAFLVVTVAAVWCACLAYAVSDMANAATSITIRLSADHTAVEPTSEPAGTAKLHIAVMQNLSATGIKYLDRPATETRYMPPAGYPVVDMIAESSSGGTIGSWAGRLQTTPAAPKEEPKEPPREEPPKEEPPLVEEPPASSAMIVGVDAGGWDWPSAVNDFSGAVKYVRSEAKNYSTDERMSLLAQHGVHLLPLFNSWTPGAAAGERGVLAWFQRYGHGGTFWQGKTDLGATTAEVMNEPGNPYMGDSRTTSDQQRYATSVEEYAKALSALPAASQPRLLVSYDGGFEGDNYGRQLVKADPRLTSLNVGWTVHPYGGHSNRELSALGNRPRVTESLHPVYVTEIGFPTAVGQSSTGDSFQWTEQQQAENITRFISWARKLEYVSVVVNFNYADYGSNDWYGIVDKTGTRHKLSYSALAAAAK